jgi:hypothetical protein
MAKPFTELTQDFSEERKALIEKEPVALWEALAEPINDEAAKRDFAEAIKRRPFFGASEFNVKPD